MDKNKVGSNPDVECRFGASIQPEIFPPGTLRIPPESCNKEISPPPPMLAPIDPSVKDNQLQEIRDNLGNVLYKLEPDFLYNAEGVINECNKVSDEFKVQFEKGETDYE